VSRSTGLGVWLAIIGSAVLRSGDLHTVVSTNQCVEIEVVNELVAFPLAGRPSESALQTEKVPLVHVIRFYRCRGSFFRPLLIPDRATSFSVRELLAKVLRLFKDDQIHHVTSTSCRSGSGKGEI
jgi:hypothetical protein